MADGRNRVVLYLKIFKNSQMIYIFHLYNLVIVENKLLQLVKTFQSLHSLYVIPCQVQYIQLSQASKLLHLLDTIL